MGSSINGEKPHTSYRMPHTGIGDKVEGEIGGMGEGGN